MAQKQKQKRPSPLDEPPTASSSDSSEEEEIPSSQPHPEEQEDDEEVSSEEQEDDDDDDDDEEEEEEEEQQQQHQPPPSKTTTPSTPAKPASSESNTASGSDTDSDSPAPTSGFKVKPIASKPIDQTPKAKAQAQPSGSKRPAENNNGHANDPKRSKKKKVSSSDDEAEEDAKKSGADYKNPPFHRLWSEEDEIAILKGMVDFTSKTGADPFKHSNAFHDFMKKTLHAEASSNQLKEKIRRLKKKFETNAGKGKNGQSPTFSKPHDQEAFDLSKKVWGNAVGEVEGGTSNGAVEKPKSNGKSAKSPKKEASRKILKPKAEIKHELTSKDSKEAVKMDMDVKIDTTSCLLEVVRADKGVGLYGLTEDVVKKGMGLVGASERAELEKQWKELLAAELEVSVKRAEVVANQARMIFDAYKSSNY